MNDKLSFGKVFVLGFALFAMFFGAGNLIFPPALGIVTGTNWMISFLVYILADAGLAILALLAFFRCQEGFQNSISIQLDKTTSFLLILFNTLCIGPFIAIPRTAATTFDIAVKPLLGASFPGWSSWVAGGIYFGDRGYRQGRFGSAIVEVSMPVAPAFAPSVNERKKGTGVKNCFVFEQEISTITTTLPSTGTSPLPVCSASR